MKIDQLPLRDGVNHCPEQDRRAQTDDPAWAQRWEQVDRLLELIEKLPFGQPDRVRLLEDAEQILDLKG
jgi:hypothetical protein